MENSKYFIVETKKIDHLPKQAPDDQLAFSENFEIEGRYFTALEFKRIKSKQEVKNIIFGQNTISNFDEQFQIIPIVKEIKKFLKCDTLYVTNIPKTLNNPKQLMEKFCIGVGKITKCFCYYTVVSGKENLERLIHFLPSIPIDGFRILASYSCIDFPILRFSNLNTKTTAEKLKSFILKYSNCNVVDIKMSKPASNKNEKYANVLFQTVEEIENVTKSFNFSTLDGNEIYVKQFLEPDLGIEIKKYEIAVVDLPKNTEKINFFKEMSNFGRIFEFFFDEQSLIGYVVFVTPESRRKLLESPNFHSFYSLVTILVGNFPPNTTCDDAKNYVVETIKMNSKSNKEKNALTVNNRNDINYNEKKEDENIQSENKNDDKNDNDSKDNIENDHSKSFSYDDFVFDPNSILEVKVYQEEDQLLSSDSTQGKLYFTLPTFSFKFSHPSLIDFVINKLQSGTYKNKTVPYAIRYYPHTKYNDNERSGILKNLGYDNAIEISPIDSKVTLSNLFDICSKFGVILYFQINLKKIPNYCIVKYNNTESFSKALEDIDGSTLNCQKISAMKFKLVKKSVDQSDNSESQEKTDESSTKKCSKNKNKKNSQKDSNPNDYYYDSNNPPQYPPFYGRPPFAMHCDPRLMMRPPFQFRPPPYNPMFHQYPYPFFPGQRPPPPPMTPEQREQLMKSWMDCYYGYYGDQNGHGCHKCHCHHKKHGQKNEQEGDEGKSDNDNDSSNDEKDADSPEMNRKCRCGHWGRKRNRFWTEGGPETEPNDQQGEFEENQGRRRGPKHCRNCRGCRNWEQREETSENPENKGEKDGANQQEAHEMQQFRGPKHWRNCRGYGNWQQRNEPTENPETNSENAEASPEMQQRRRPKCWGNYRGYGNWQQRSEPTENPEANNENAEASPDMKQFREPKCWGHRRGNWQQRGEPTENPEANNENTEAPPEMQQRRGPKCWGHRRGNWEQRRGPTENPETNNSNDNGDADDSPEMQMRRRGPKCFKSGRRRWEERFGEPEDSVQNDERRGPGFRGGCRHHRGPHFHRGGFGPHFDPRFDPRGNWWANFGYPNFDQEGEENDEQADEKSGQKEGRKRGGRCGRGGRDNQTEKREQENIDYENDDDDEISNKEQDKKGEEFADKKEENKKEETKNDDFKVDDDEIEEDEEEDNDDEFNTNKMDDDDDEDDDEDINDEDDDNEEDEY